MNTFPYSKSSSNLPLWQPDTSRTPLEHLVEFVLTGILARNAPPETTALAQGVLHADLAKTRVVVLGGGTGLSTVLGGNSQMPNWPDQCFVGLKTAFSDLHTIVCTTDDGGSTGLLLKSLPLIGIGDLRKILVSFILPEDLRRRYAISQEQTQRLIRLIHNLFNYRFADQKTGFELLMDPLRVVAPQLRLCCPRPLADYFRALGAYISPKGQGPTIEPAGHALGNLLLASAIFRAAQGLTDRAPGLRQIQTGIDEIACMIGAPRGRIHPATATPGQLKFRYANGVEVYGQSKSARVRRNCPVERIVAEFADTPAVSNVVCKAIQRADLIVYAPGSLYTSIIPVLQISPIAASIRANKKALKILGANSWIQEGETDISLQNQNRGFLVSELIEAYDRNIPHGIEGLFNVVLSANLEHVPNYILRNYALEGKSPIHLDRNRVEAMGIRPIEATLFSSRRQEELRVIHHDAERFALAIRTLLYADRYLKKQKGYSLRHRMIRKSLYTRKKQLSSPKSNITHKSLPLCDYLKGIKAALDQKDFEPQSLKNFMTDLIWENRDIKASHLEFFQGVRVIAAQKWNRSIEWDNVLGYYDPQDRYLKLHAELLTDPKRLGEDLLIALGESLLGERGRLDTRHRRQVGGRKPL